MCLMLGVRKNRTADSFKSAYVNSKYDAVYRAYACCVSHMCHFVKAVQADDSKSGTLSIELRGRASNYNRKSLHILASGASVSIVLNLKSDLRSHSRRSSSIYSYTGVVIVVPKPRILASRVTPRSMIRLPACISSMRRWTCGEK